MKILESSPLMNQIYIVCLAMKNKKEFNCQPMLLDPFHSMSVELLIYRPPQIQGILIVDIRCRRSNASDLILGYQQKLDWYSVNTNSGTSPETLLCEEIIETYQTLKENYEQAKRELMGS